jgi:transcriptional regulator with XRE-family HTH domain
MDPGGGPTIARLRLGVLLRSYRTAAGITGSQAAAAINASGSKISRIESGLLPVRDEDVAALLTLYGVSADSERAEPLDLARQSSRPGRWDQYPGELPAHIKHALNLEAAAILIVTYDPHAVPALLQTPAYAAAAASYDSLRGAWRGGLTPDLLGLRRDILARARPPRLWGLIDETVLQRQPGDGADVMTGPMGQLAQLADAAQSPSVTIQLVPRQAAVTTAAAGPFSILRLTTGRDIPDVVLLEELTTVTLLEQRRDVDRYWAFINQLAVEARTPQSSIQLLRRAARHTTARPP